MIALTTAVPCPTCGATAYADPHGVEVTTFGDPVRRWLPGPITCPTPRCGEVCKVCRREVGDIHGPDCGPLMITKTERPCHVHREDCR